MTASNVSLYRRMLGEIAADDPEAYAPPIFVSLIALAVMFVPWRLVERVGIIGLAMWLVWSLWGNGIVR